MSVGKSIVDVTTAKDTIATFVARIFVKDAPIAAQNVENFLL
jgi:hypothetical protein